MTEEGEDDGLGGRCRFCGAELPAGGAVCPECNRETTGGYSFRLARPLWVRVLIYAVLVLFFGSLLAWGVELAVRR